jgi:hypothetical protein
MAMQQPRVWPLSIFHKGPSIENLTQRDLEAENAVLSQPAAPIIGREIGVTQSLVCVGFPQF